jgi:hypothetical protein
MIFRKILISLLLTVPALGYIPKGYFILQNTVENNGTPPYLIEQEVQFTSNQDPIFLKETWQIESDNSMKLTVVGMKDLKDQLKMQFIYSGDTRSSFEGGKRVVNKIGQDFFEKLFHFHSAEAFANSLIQMNIVPSSIFAKKVAKKSKDFDNKTESFVRLARVGGTVSYAFGTPTQPEVPNLNPGIWIEQDHFYIRKIRLPSGAEITADKQSNTAKGLIFPMRRSVRWGNSVVQIQTLSVSAKSKFTATSLEPTHLEGLENLPAKAEILDFYSRFR